MANFVNLSAEELPSFLVDDDNDDGDEMDGFHG